MDFQPFENWGEICIRDVEFISFSLTVLMTIRGEFERDVGVVRGEWFLLYGSARKDSGELGVTAHLRHDLVVTIDPKMGKDRIRGWAKAG